MFVLEKPENNTCPHFSIANIYSSFQLPPPFPWPRVRYQVRSAKQTSFKALNGLFNSRDLCPYMVCSVSMSFDFPSSILYTKLILASLTSHLQSSLLSSTTDCELILYHYPRFHPQLIYLYPILIFRQLVNHKLTYFGFSHQIPSSFRLLNVFKYLFCINFYSFVCTVPIFYDYITFLLYIL